MLTFPTAKAIRNNHSAAAQRADQREPTELLVPAPSEAERTGARVGLVVHLELPERDSVVSGADQSDADARPGASLAGIPDLHQLARAVRDLVRVAAPGIITRVSVEPALGEPELAQPEPAQLRPVPCSPSNAARSELPAAPEGDGIDIDLVGRTLRVDGQPVELTRREFDLLAYLHGRRAVALSRRELMNAVWQTGYLAGDRTIDVHVRRVRAKLGRHANRLTTLRGFGYRFD